MSSLDVPGLDVLSRVRARDIFFDDEVRPDESVLTVFEIKCGQTRPTYVHAKYSPIADGMPEHSAIEVVAPITIIG